MESPFVYMIRVEGHLSERWSDWFGGLALRYDPDGVTALAGSLSDQAALLGVLGKLQALNVTILSVNREPAEQWRQDTGKNHVRDGNGA